MARCCFSFSESFCMVEYIYMNGGNQATDKVTAVAIYVCCCVLSVTVWLGFGRFGCTISIWTFRCRRRFSVFFRFFIFISFSLFEWKRMLSLSMALDCLFSHERNWHSKLHRLFFPYDFPSFRSLFSSLAL